MTEEKFIGEDIIFFNRLKEAGVQAYAHTGAIVTHMKTIQYDLDYYALFWSTVQKEQEKKLCPSCNHDPALVEKDCKCCNKGEDND
jgi:hypothetical protein